MARLVVLPLDGGALPVAQGALELALLAVVVGATLRPPGLHLLQLAAVAAVRVRVAAALLAARGGVRPLDDGHTVPPVALAGLGGRAGGGLLARLVLVAGGSLLGTGADGGAGSDGALQHLSGYLLNVLDGVGRREVSVGLVVDQILQDLLGAHVEARAEHVGLFLAGGGLLCERKQKARSQIPP